MYGSFFVFRCYVFIPKYDGFKNLKFQFICKIHVFCGPNSLTPFIVTPKLRIIWFFGAGFPCEKNVAYPTSHYDISGRLTK